MTPFKKISEKSKIIFLEQGSSLFKGFFSANKMHPFIYETESTRDIIYVEVLQFVPTEKGCYVEVLEDKTYN